MNIQATARNVAKKSLPWVRRLAVLAQAYEIAQRHQEAKAAVESLPVGKERAKAMHRLANIEVELAKALEHIK